MINSCALSQIFCPLTLFTSCFRIHRHKIYCHELIEHIFSYEAWAINFSDCCSSSIPGMNIKFLATVLMHLFKKCAPYCVGLICSVVLNKLPTQTIFNPCWYKGLWDINFVSSHAGSDPHLLRYISNCHINEVSK